MQLEVFNRDTVTGQAVIEPPLVQVNGNGRLLFNGPAWAFLAMQFAWMHARDEEVVLLFDVETRTAGVQPVPPKTAGPPVTPAGARWRVETMRSVQWPRAVSAGAFVDHYLVAVGQYPAGLVRGPGPRMVTFPVGALRTPGRRTAPESPVRASGNLAGLPRQPLSDPCRGHLTEPTSGVPRG